MKTKRIKIKHIYTVVREFDIDPKKLKDEIDFFGAVADETGEYLYGGTGRKETITVEMHVNGKKI